MPQRKKRAVIGGLVLLTVIGLGLALACHQYRTIHSTQVVLMDTLVEILAQGPPHRTEGATRQAFEEMRRIDRKFGYQESMTSELNTRHVLKDTETQVLIRTAMAIGHASHGAFDITLQPVLEAWGFTPAKAYRIPPPSVLARWATRPVSTGVQCLPDGRTVISAPGVGIDLGGIAKGYAADRAAAVMRREGIRTGLINAGGDIMAFGPRTWKIGIRHPRTPDLLTVILIRNRAVATSGDYERFFIAHGRRYCHILDPATGRPAAKLVSATVIAPSCLEADAWATALFVQGPAALGAVLKRKGYDWIAIDPSGTVRASPAIAPYCPPHIVLARP